MICRENYRSIQKKLTDVSKNIRFQNICFTNMCKTNVKFHVGLYVIDIDEVEELFHV